MSTHVLVVDDVPHVRARLFDLLDRTAGLEPVGASPADASFWPLLERVRPHVVLVGFAPSGEAGAVFCRRAKSGRQPPYLLATIPTAEPEDVLPALLAGADGIVRRDAGDGEILAAVRALAAGVRLWREAG